MARLNVNVDHIATIREARRTVEPDPVLAALLAELGGAEGIVAHLREDRRHIKERDLRILRQTIRTKLNMEMASTDEMIKIALDVKPDMATVVPERREEITTEGGLDVASNLKSIEKTVRALKEGGILVSLFIDPDIKQVEASWESGADIVEIHTGHYAEAKTPQGIEKEFRKIQNAVQAAIKLGLRVGAGHGLNYINIKRIRAIEEIEEFNIGHSIVARAVFIGMEKAVREMVELLR